MDFKINPALFNFTALNKHLKSPSLIKLFNWEYWSFNTIYTPLYPYWFLLSAKARSFFFFNASNPTIDFGGFVLEKKSDIYNILPQAYFPKTLLIPPHTNSNRIQLMIASRGIQFPAIVKPDIGGRGRGVKKVENVDAAITYINSYKEHPMLVQDLIPYKNEVGIFYYRYPWMAKGHISGIVAKEFLTIEGDGISTIEQLLSKNTRYILQLATLRKMPSIDLKQVLANKEVKVLVPYGNHARGAKFLDWSDKITPALVASIDAICQQIPHFYFGRLDLMYDTWSQMEEGKNISIVELNGAGSEPTHIYDPKHSLFYAYGEIIRHWKILLKISIYNHKNKIGRFLTFKEGRQMLRDNAEAEKVLNAFE